MPPPALSETEHRTMVLSYTPKIPWPPPLPAPLARTVQSAMVQPEPTCSAPPYGDGLGPTEQRSTEFPSNVWIAPTVPLAEQSAIRLPSWAKIPAAHAETSHRRMIANWPATIPVPVPTFLTR